MYFIRAQHFPNEIYSMLWLSSMSTDYIWFIIYRCRLHNKIYTESSQPNWRIETNKHKTLLLRPQQQQLQKKYEKPQNVLLRSNFCDKHTHGMCARASKRQHKHKTDNKKSDYLFLFQLKTINFVCNCRLFCYSFLFTTLNTSRFYSTMWLIPFWISLGVYIFFHFLSCFRCK